MGRTGRKCQQQTPCRGQNLLSPAAGKGIRVVLSIMNHKRRRGIDLAATALGIALIITAVILGSFLEISVQLPLALVGVLLM